MFESEQAYAHNAIDNLNKSLRVYTLNEANIHVYRFLLSIFWTVLLKIYIFFS